jgi:hypothetical protein
MDQDEFWALIGGLHTADADVLVERLAAMPVAAITGFADRLAEALHALDTPELADQPVWDVEQDPEADEPLSPSDDAFLYTRCAVVASGRETYERVRAEPTALAGRWDLGREDLLYVAPRAYEQATGEEWDHESPVSYETGSAWPEDASAPLGHGPWRDSGMTHVEWLRVRLDLMDAFLFQITMQDPRERAELLDRWGLTEADFAGTHPQALMLMPGDVGDDYTVLLREAGLTDLPFVHIAIPPGEGWDLEPDLHDYEQWNGRNVRVRLRIDQQTEHGWSEEELGRAVRGLAAHAVLAVLAREGVAALPELVRDRDAASDLVPFSR